MSSRVTSLRRSQVVRAATQSPVLRDLRHLDSIPRWWLKKATFADPSPKVVKQKDRIKWWNIVPGDQVRVLGDRESTIREVLSINRFSNRVYLKGIRNEGESSQQPPRSINVHYSKCQLFIGKHEFPPVDGSTETRILPVFATRLGTSKPTWNVVKHCWEWKRFAVNTTPRLPHWSKEIAADLSDRVQIPWPEKEPEEKAPPTDYDTKAEVVAELTYEPSPITTRLLDPVPRQHLQGKQERKYLNSVLNPGAPFDKTAAMEVHVEQELSPIHSRAKKQKRWQELQAYRRQLLHDYIAAEMAPEKMRKHKTSKEARAWAVFKWREKMQEMQKAEKQRRWVNRGAQARLIRKQARKAKKAAREERRLKELSLAVADNQIIPEGVPTRSPQP
ncbi:hypothetical protein GLOTRDRAFT_125909 [Gloeophyllum trabeum ATCC 11539]|uniref:KOW domain-containing protein n=1 Tax=Gloeophyllum trabeum (strain ATCC 11539 / FP-39264 / Madison 617) TaxID=670483 RepID=S7QIZ0_GLOTA|nr:uncharacterized protein GLOTRDRAFT_125909 [Gloeophyllum trabeum ATCC 11539]EPQ59611.1 hypothetical protein GLOTRDRAFT_125909 [Gloeophyllum trabeum ATCC 11539]